MIKRFELIAIAGLVAFWPANSVFAERDRDDHHGHGKHHDKHDDHHSGFGIHFGGGGDRGGSVHFGDDHHDDYDHHRDHGYRRHNSGDYGQHRHNSGWQRSGWYGSGWNFVVPHYDRNYHGTYYRNGDGYYYVPRTYATQSQSYIRAESVALEFGGYSHVEDLAGRLERAANQLCLELHYNYRHNPDFAATYGEAYQILKTAKFVHDKENQGDREEVARSLDEADGRFHQIQGEVARWSRQQNRQIGQGSAQAKLQLVEATLHHLMHDVGVKGSHGAPAVSQPSGGEVAPPPPAN